MQMVEEGKAPAFKFLIEQGYFVPDIVSSYPTMSMTIDSTILTGTYADQHRIPGLIWFNEVDNQVISYGSGLREIWDNGIKDVIQNGIIHLNEEHLSGNTVTIHEVLESQGLQAASINGLLYRGPKTHQLSVPKTIAATPILPENIKVHGPTYLSLGVLSHYSKDNAWERTMWNRMGMNNAFTVNELRHLIRNNRLPSFTLGYFPDMDKELHKKGPEATKGITDTDRDLQGLLNEFPSWEEAVRQVVWIIHGDSEQSSVLKKEDNALIDLNQLLKGYQFWEEKNKHADLAIGINERMAYIYLLKEDINFKDILEILMKDKRIAFIAYKEEENKVLSTNGENLTFSPNGPLTDSYGQTWSIQGNCSILDLHIQNQRITYGNYPDALARLHGALHSHSGRFIIVDAKPGYEFIESHSFDHAGGGAHGSLHRIDSVVPLIVAGTTERPTTNRLVDFKEWIQRIAAQ